MNEKGQEYRCFFFLTAQVAVDKEDGVIDVLRTPDTGPATGLAPLPALRADSRISFTEYRVKLIKAGWQELFPVEGCDEILKDQTKIERPRIHFFGVPAGLKISPRHNGNGDSH